MSSQHHSECHFGIQNDAVCTRISSRIRCKVCAHTHTQDFKTTNFLAAILTRHGTVM